MPKFLRVLAILYTGALLALSLMKLDVQDVNFSNGDKVFHSLSYFGLTLLWFLQSFMGKKDTSLTRRLIAVSLAILAFGMIVEILQLALTNYRSFDWYDMLANTFGVLVAALFITAIQTYLLRLKKWFLNAQNR